MDRDERFIRDFHKAMSRNRWRELKQQKKKLLGTIFGVIFMGLMVIMLFGMILLMIIESRELRTSDLILWTIVIQFIGYYMVGMVEPTSLTVVANELEFLYPAPLKRRSIARYRSRGIHRGMIFFLVLTGLTITWALSINNDLTPWHMAGIAVGSVLTNIIFFNVLRICRNLKRVLGSDHLRTWKWFRRSFYAIPFYSIMIFVAGDLIGIDTSTAALHVLLSMIWLPVLTSYMIWGTWYQVVLILPLLAGISILSIRYAQQVHTKLLSESYVEPEAKESFWVRLFRINTGKERWYLPTMSFNTGAGVLRAKNVIFMSRPPWKPLMSLLMFGIMGIVYTWILPFPMAILVMSLFVLMTVGTVSRHISSEGRDLDKIRMLPDTGANIFWNYSIPGIIACIIMTIIMLTAVLLIHKPRFGVAIAIYVFLIIFNVAFFINRQEGYIRKMRKKEIAEVLEGKPSFGFIGLIGTLYGLLMVITFGYNKIDIMYFLLYLSVVFAWFLTSSIIRIGKEMDEFLIPKGLRQGKKSWKAKIRLWSNRSWLERSRVVISIALAFSFLLIPWPYHFSDYPPLEDSDPLPENYWTLYNSTEEWIGEDSRMIRHIVIKSGGILKLVNTRFSVPDRMESPYGIYVLEGGTLILENSTIEGRGDMGYILRVYGTMIARNSTFEGMWGDEDKENYDGGIEIYSSDVEITNCTIRNGTTNGILIGKGTPRIENCVITNNGDDGIEIDDGNPFISNSIISENEWGIVQLFGSKAFMKNCTIESNDCDGINLAGASAVLVDCTIRNNGDIGINMKQSHVKMNGCVIEGNEKAVEDSDHFRFMDFIF